MPRSVRRTRPGPHSLLAELSPCAGLLACAIAAAFGCAPRQAPVAAPVPSLVAVRTLAPGIVFDMRYAGPNNFTGAPVPGYDAPECWLSPPAAEALAAVQRDLAQRKLGLVAWDCYRPQRAVTAFMHWAADPDQTGRARWYPNVAKSALVPESYIAERSGHSRGSTVDVGLVRHAADGRVEELDMGTPFDFFDPRAHTAAQGLSPEERKHRALLVEAMRARGFVNFDKEWWHYTLRDEPWPGTYLDVPVRTVSSPD